MSNRLCRDIGHSWQNTTSDMWRKCTRKDCHVAQRFRNGKWIDYIRIVKREENTHTPIQGMMFH